eukprot:1085732-Prymnesium_polylepis.1
MEEVSMSNQTVYVPLNICTCMRMGHTAATLHASRIFKSHIRFRYHAADVHSLNRCYLYMHTVFGHRVSSSDTSVSDIMKLMCTV